MFCTAIVRSRKLFCWLLCLFIAPVFAQDTRQPAVPGEYYSDVTVVGGGLLLSADGRWACFQSTGGLGVVDLHTGEVEGLSNRNEYWMLMMMERPDASWSPVKSQLAFKLYREGRPSLNLWSPGDKSPRELMPIPRDLYNSISKPPVWSADGKTLYVVISQDLPWPKSHPADDYPPTRNENVTLRLTEPYGTTVRRARFEKEYEDAYAESRRNLIMAIDVATGRAGVLAKGNDIAGIYLSPDNQRLAVAQAKVSIPDKPIQWTRQAHIDIYLLDTVPIAELPAIDLEELDDRRAGWFDHKGRRLDPILADVHLNRTDLLFNTFVRTFGNNGNPLLSWSPDSKRFAYATVGRESEGDVFVYDVASAGLSNLTAEVTLPESPKSLGYGDHYTWQHNSLKFGNLYPPLWLPDSKSLVVVGRGDVWQIFPNSRKKPRLLTKNLPQEVQRIIPAYSQNMASANSNGHITLIAKDRQSRMDSLWKLDVDKRRSRKQVDTGVWVNAVVHADAKGERIVYTGQPWEAATNVYQVVGSDKPELATKYQLQLAERLYPQSRVLQWQKENGKTAYGLLYLPPGTSTANKAPMILDGYPGKIDSILDSKGKGGAKFLNDSLYGLLQEGFAVLYPDIELSDTGVYERPMWQTVDAVKAATDAALATGVIDADRLGIMGQSYGGYMTQAVITQTDRFKAALSRAGLSDLYGGYAGGGRMSLNWSEVGQGRLAVPPWVDPKRYTDNSPLTYFDKVKTPLLLIHGEGDGTVPVEMSRESFRALERLKNPTVFARYRRLGHGVTQEVNRRERLWFRQHLLNGKAVAGLAEQGSFFLGGDLAQDKLVSESESEDK